jgi:hypothetical protein
VVQEYDKVETMMNPSRGHSLNRKLRKAMQQNGSYSDSQMMKVGSGRSLDQGSPRATVVRLDETLVADDPNDPISDGDMESPRECNTSTPRTGIKSRQYAAIGGSPRSKPKTARAGADSPTHFTENVAKTRYFTQNREQSVCESESARIRERATRHKKESSGQYNANSSRSHQDHYADGFDDLSAEHYDASQMLPSKPKRSKAIPAEAKKSGATQALSINDISDDEVDILKDADIKPTTFPSSKKSNLKKKVGGETYEVLQIFSAGHPWFFGGDRKSRSLIYDINDGLLRIEGGDTPPLTTAVNSISNVEFSDDNAKMVIHKSRDRTFGGATQICLTLGGADQSAALAKRISSPVIKLIHKSGSVYLLSHCIPIPMLMVYHTESIWTRFLQQHVNRQNQGQIVRHRSQMMSD